MEPKTIIFIGPQGSGKGTQVEQLLKHLKATDHAPIVHVQTGQGFRALREEGGYTAERVVDLIDHGELVPDFITNAFVVDQLRVEMTEAAHIVMDGFPRNLSQAQFIDDVLAFYMRNEVMVIHLDTEESVVIKRMKARGRKDDTDEGIAERLRLYKEMTEPVLNFYEERDGAEVIDIDGGQTIEAVSEEVKNALGL